MTSHDDILNDPEFKEWAEEVERDLVPKIDGSAATVCLVPKGATDVKFAVELGFSVMLDKPIIIAVEKGADVPAKLKLLADEIIEIDFRANPQIANEAVEAAVLRLEERGLIRGE